MGTPGARGRFGRGFEHLTLSKLTNQRGTTSPGRWSAPSDLPERRAEAEVGVIRNVRATQRIEGLTGNPMLLSTLVLVCRRIGKLPSRRVDRYRAPWASCGSRPATGLFTSAAAGH